jgi:hypothetical protein
MDCMSQQQKIIVQKRGRLVSPTGCLLAVGLIVLGAMTSNAYSGSKYCRPFGSGAPWNVPVAEVPRHPGSSTFVQRLWNDAPDRPGNFNLSFDEYTYPVYFVADSAGLYPVRTRWRSNLDGKKIPWNPRWRPASGSDAQVIILDPDVGAEWDLFAVSFDGTTVHAQNGSRIPGDYRRKEDGHPPSRGAGIQYLAMLVRPVEIAQGGIHHALSMPIRNTDGEYYVPPATKLEFPDQPPDGIPEGMRFALDVSDGEIEQWLLTLPRSLSAETRRSARIIATALRDYGWFITDTSGAAHLQFEDRLTAEAGWRKLGLHEQTVGGRAYPRDLLDGLITPQRIYTLVPSDQYPTSPASGDRRNDSCD